MNRKLKIGGASLNQTPIDWENNIQNIQMAISEGIAKKIDVLCLPELCITGYGCEDLFLTNWVPAKALQKLLELVPLTKGIAVALGLPVIWKDGNVYNTTCFVADQQIKCFYAKQKLARQGVHYEPRWFSPWPVNVIQEIEIEGRLYPFGHTSVDYKGITISFEICEDAWQQDRPVEKLENKPDLVLNPSASHFAFGKAKFREELVKRISREDHCVYIYTNQLGNESGRLIYDGDILIAEHGKVIGRNQRLSFQSFNLLAVDYDFSGESGEAAIAIDFENEYDEFTHAAALALFDYLRKSRSKGFVLSLSGGADSSTIAALVALSVRFAVQQLGKERLEAKLGMRFGGEDEKAIVSQLFATAYQATDNSSEHTFDSARTLAESIGATFFDWRIDDVTCSYQNKIERAIGRALNWDLDDITLQNIQSRSRSPGIWMLANLESKLLLATSNRSEGDVGYATMDGDTSGSISPIAGVSKKFILEWLVFAQKEYRLEGLEKVNELVPTAELRPLEQSQTDEADLMPYDVLVEIERYAILEGLPPKVIFEHMESKHDPLQLRGWIRKFFRLWARNQWKRERYAPSFHFDDFNIDPRSWYRFPILSGSFQEELGEI